MNASAAEHAKANARLGLFLRAMLIIKSMQMPALNAERALRFARQVLFPRDELNPEYEKNGHTSPKGSCMTIF